MDSQNRIIFQRNLDPEVEMKQDIYWIKSVILALKKVSVFCLGPMVFLLPKRFNYLDLQSFDFECTWWRLFQNAS